MSEGDAPPAEATSADAPDAQEAVAQGAQDGAESVAATEAQEQEHADEVQPRNDNDDDVQPPPADAAETPAQDGDGAGAGDEAESSAAGAGSTAEGEREAAEDGGASTGDAADAVAESEAAAEGDAVAAAADGAETGNADADAAAAAAEGEGEGEGDGGGEAEGDAEGEGDAAAEAVEEDEPLTPRRQQLLERLRATLEEETDKLNKLTARRVELQQSIDASQRERAAASSQAEEAIAEIERDRREREASIRAKYAPKPKADEAAADGAAEAAVDEKAAQDREDIALVSALRHFIVALTDVDTSDELANVLDKKMKDAADEVVGRAMMHGLAPEMADVCREFFVGDRRLSRRDTLAGVPSKVDPVCDWVLWMSGRSPHDPRKRGSIVSAMPVVPSASMESLLGDWCLESSVEPLLQCEAENREALRMNYNGAERRLPVVMRTNDIALVRMAVADGTHSLMKTRTSVGVCAPTGPSIDLSESIARAPFAVLIQPPRAAVVTANLRCQAPN